MTLSSALLERLAFNEVYQSTSLIQNFREGRPEFPEINHPRRLKAVVGHWVHESMLPALQKPIWFATSLRDPVSRTRSQYRFDVGLRGGRWPKVDTHEFLERNSNVMSKFLCGAFPSIAADFDNQLSAAKAIISGFDCVFDISEADDSIFDLVKMATGISEPVKRVNDSSHVMAELEVDDKEIMKYQDLDIELYKWFKETVSAEATSKNRVHSREMRRKFAELAAKPFDSGSVIRFLAPKIAEEYFWASEDVEVRQRKLEEKIEFYHSVMADLRKLHKASAWVKGEEEEK
ncbi:hypothetical protein [Oceanicella actignis]|nr:hypothetical protein [Oceanicella actignis]